MKKLYGTLDIVITTEKAVGIENPNWSGNPKGYYERLRSAKENRLDNNEFIWLPKSQIKFEDNEITHIKNWLCDKYGFTTEDSIKKREERINKYKVFVKKAKKLGIKGIRMRMKIKTILAKAEEQGIAIIY